MKRDANGWGGNLMPYYFAGFLTLIPVLSLVLAGLVYFAQHNLLLIGSVAWLALTLIGFAVYRFWPDQHNKQCTADEAFYTNYDEVSEKVNDSDPLHDRLPQLLDERTDWSKAEREIWLAGIGQIEILLNREPDWNTLPEYILQLLSDVAISYKGIGDVSDAPARATWRINQIPSKAATLDAERFIAEMHFSLPELLLVFSVSSHRYRQVLLANLPFAESISLATIMKLYRRQSSIIKGARWINNIRRTTRLFNPIAAITAELREHFTQKVFTHANNKLQTDLKRLLLQELLQTAMDLNSGRLKNSPQEIARHSIEVMSQHDDQFDAAPKPLRIVIVGQINSGKSSLVNALAMEFQAETDLLPTTDKSTVYVLEPEGQTPLHIVDTAGLDSKPQNLDQQTQLAFRSDLVIHVVKATQPARSADKLLCDSIGKAFREQPLRRRPPAMMIMTHVDQLSPKAQWCPPYDLSTNVPKAMSISSALRSAQLQLNLPTEIPKIPVCLSVEHGLYNVDAVMSQIMLLEQDARQSQLNRWRSEIRDDKHVNWLKKWNQIRQLGRVFGQSITR